MRAQGRRYDALRPVALTPSYIQHAEGSVFIEMGNTKLIVTATVEESVPPFLRNKKKGWVTAEYAMLPRSAQERIKREAGKLGGRTHEIQRLIGRSLRAITDMEGLGERSVTLDCDVIQADGGTRTAAITGAFVAFVYALRFLKKEGKIGALPVRDFLAAVSVGKVGGDILLDLDYSEDSKAEVDMNIVMTGQGQFVEVQGTAEQAPFAQKELDQMLRMAARGIRKLIAKQRALLGDLV